MTLPPRDTTTLLPPSGEQYEIRHGAQTATIVEVGAGVRSYTVDDRPVLQSYPRDAMCDGAHGTPLVPWPNRIGGGRYNFDGTEYQLPLTEVDKQNAIHGLLRWTPWRLLDHTPAGVVLGVRLHPSPGYPFILDVTVDYRVGPDGLRVRTTACNVGAVACPYGAGQHPYLSPGSGLIDECTLQFGANTRICTDADRQLPTGTQAVRGTVFDFHSPRMIGDLSVDFAFTGLQRDARGRSWVRLAGPDRRTAAFWVDESYSFIELYTADTLAPNRRRRGLGTEPMTCPPNAFQSGEHVIRLAPGASTTATWGAQLT
ncbi:MAG TPA: aldose 1-epimerase family protein [Candidatus Nanopelagicales bacterium]|jgi:aldose 1-epimerase